MELFKQIDCAFVPTAEDKATVELAFTVIVPLNEGLTHGPEEVTV